MMKISGKRKAIPEEEQREEEAGSAPLLLKQPTADGPAALPRYIQPVGEHHRLAAGSEWWVGYGRGAYEEVTHLRGILIYNRTAHIFLTYEEASQACLLLPELVQQGQMLVGQADEQQQTEPVL